MKYVIIILTLAIVLFSLSACNDKNSLIGFPGSNFNFHNVTLPDSCIEYYYAWGDSVRNLSENTKLIIGTYNNTEIRSLIRFSGFPADAIVTTGTAKMRLTTLKNYNLSNISITVHRVSQKWYENQVTWSNAQTSVLWNTSGGSFDSGEIATLNVNTNTDTVYVDLPTSLIQHWCDADTAYTNYGLILKVSGYRDGQFVEFNSAETSFYPQLEFSYTKSNETKTYKAKAVEDAFIHNRAMNPAIEPNVIRLWNIEPRSMFIKFKLPWQVFAAADPSIQSEEDLKKITINYADFVLTKTDEDAPVTMSSFSISVARYKNVPTLNQNYFKYVDTEYYNTTRDSLSNGTFKVKVTNLFQALVSGAKTNNGMIIQSNYRNFDFTHLNFHPFNDPDPLKRPKINIRFTTLKDRSEK